MSKDKVTRIRKDRTGPAKTGQFKNLVNAAKAGQISMVEGSNRKQVLTFDGKKYTNGLPEMKWSGGKVVE